MFINDLYDKLVSFGVPAEFISRERDGYFNHMCIHTYLRSFCIGEDAVECDVEIWHDTQKREIWIHCGNVNSIVGDAVKVDKYLNTNRICLQIYYKGYLVSNVCVW